MNGEVKAYRMNDPITWAEFKQMPDDIRVLYINALREKYGVPDMWLAKMFGKSQTYFSHEVQRLGIAIGRVEGCKRKKWDKEGFLAWWHGVPKIEEASDENVVEEAVEPVAEPIPEPIKEEPKKAVPQEGRLVFEGRAEDILKTASALLGGANLRIWISWDTPKECLCVGDERG